MMKKITALLLGAALMLAAGSASALTIANGGFETGNFSGWSTIGPNTATVVTTATAADSSVYNPTEGKYMASLTATSGAAQYLVSWNAGDWISFNWAFLAKDYLPYDDYSLFLLFDNAAGQLANVKLSNVSAIGNYGDTGWQTYGYHFTSAGQGFIQFNSVNALDSTLDSVLLVDNVSNAPVPEPGTMVLLGVGLLGLAVYGKRRMNNKES